jgi:integrase
MPSPGARFAVFFAAIGFAGLRPSEAAGLRLVDVELPDVGWGAARLRGAIPSPGTRYTDDGASRQEKGLKHRPENAVRLVPLPPSLVAWIVAHVERWPSDTGLVFTNNAERSVTPENYGRVWNRAKASVWPADHLLTATNPYDLRHSAATAMLRAHVPLPEVARRLGHSVDVLLRVYAGVFEDERERSNTFIDAEFARQGVGL